MRPGRKGPRKRRPRMDHPRQPPRFNEAGAQRPQKGGRVPGHGLQGRRGFNEAGAQRPQKVRPQSVSALSAPGFNEAGAQRPQKGDFPGCSAPSTPYRFNEAGAQRPQKARLVHHPSPVRLASMRPGRKGPRKDGARDQGGRHVRASMRPGRKGPRKAGRRNPGCLLFQCFNEAGAQRPQKASHYNSLRWLANFTPLQEGACVAPIIKPERAGQAIHDVKYQSKTNALAEFERPRANLRHRAARNRPAVSPSGGSPAAPSRSETPPAIAIISQSRSARARRTSFRCWSRPDRSCRPGLRR